MRHKFYVIVDTDKDLSTDDKLNILHNLRARVAGLHNDPFVELEDAKITVSREISNEELGEVLREKMR